MPDLRLSWADYPGGYSTQVTPGATTIGTTEAVGGGVGGVDVTVEVVNEIGSSIAFALNLPTFDDPADDLPPDSQLKLIGDSGTAGVNDTSTTILTFASSDPSVDDGVTGLKFRIDDIDTGPANDVDGSSAAVDDHEDIVSIRAFDPLGNPIPVTITPGGGMSQLGDTLTGTSQGVATDGAQSALIEIAGPVGRVEIDYDNGDTGSQEVLVSDLLFTTIDVDPLNDPIANDDSASTLEDTLIEDINVLGNDTDPNGDPLTVTGAAAPNGTVTVNGDGTLDYLPNSGFVGTDIISYEISDGAGGTDIGQVTVTVTAPPNALPDAVDDAETVLFETPTIIDVLSNDSDPDGDPLTVTAASSPNGTLVINGDNTLEYTPADSFIGEDTITYTIDDGVSGTDTAQVIVTVAGGNVAPDANPDTASTIEDVLIEDIDILGNDTDLNGDPLTVTSATAPNGTVTINGDGTLDYLPDPGFTGTDTIAYAISDGNGGTDTSTVTVTVTAAPNTPPVANVDAASGAPEVLIPNIDVLGNDTDADGDPLTVTGASAPNGTVTINGDGTLNYTSDVGFSGTDTITYAISDGNGGTATSTVTVTIAANTPPDAVDDTASGFSEVLIPNIDVLGNDSDPDGDPLSVTGASAPNGTVTVNGDGTLNYTSDVGFIGTDTITYAISDGNGGSDTATVTVTVTAPVGGDPVAVNDSVTVSTDILAEDINILGNDSDPDGDPLTVTSAVSGNGATVVINGDGTLDYTSAPGFEGTDLVTYVIDDGNGGTDTGVLRVSVRDTGPANQDPNAAPDVASGTSEVLIPNIDVLGNDSDPDGDPLTVTSATAPNGTVTINGDGTLNYTSDVGFTGTDTITYAISDGNGGTDTSTVTVTVAAAGPNDPPVANDEFASTPVDTLIDDLNVLGNDTDANGDPLTVTTATAPNGTVTINGDGTLDYQPDPGFTGSDTITYTISDGNGGTDTGVVNITVGTTNSPPVANSDAASGTSGTLIPSIDILSNDTDPDGDPLGILTATASNGTVTINGDNTLSYTSNPGFVGTDTITYEITDGVAGNATSTVTVTVAVAPPNTDPVANNDAETASTAIPLNNIDVLGNDTDADGDPLTVTAATAPNGTVTINGDGTINYTSDPGFEGTDLITYTIDDGNGGTDTGIVRMSVSDTGPGGMPPVAVDDTASGTSEVLIPNIDVLGNDSDPDGDPLSVTGASAPNGTVTVNGDGTLNYTSDVGFIGTDTITYAISDGNGGSDTATVTVTVTAPVGGDPVAVNDSVTVSTDILAEDINILGNDSDPDGDPLTVTSAVSGNGATVVINGDGTLDYTSAPGFEGTDLVTYVIDDGNGGTDTGVLRVSVRDTGPANQAPTANDDTASTPVDTLLDDLDVLGNDTDPDGDPLTVIAASAPNGTVTINGDGTLDYQPDPGFTGPDTISYTISDGNGGTDIGSVAVTVGGGNLPPVATDDTASGTSEVLIPNIDVLGNDSDPDGDPLTVTAATAPNGTVTINGDGTLNYTSDVGFVGTDTITYTIDDGISGTDTATVTVTVAAPTPNDPPVAVNDAEMASTGIPLNNIDVLGNDSDPDGDPLTVTAATSPNGTITINGDGTINYTSDPGFEGTDLITYTITDGNGGFDTAIVRMSVRDNGNPPTPVDDAASTPVDTLLDDLDVLGNDSDPDGDPLTVISATAPNGTVTVNGDGTLDYQPDPGFEGFDTITYVVDDGNGNTAPADVIVTVGNPPSNLPPVAVDDAPETTPVDTLISNIDVLGNDSDPDGDPLTVTAAFAPNGTVTINGDGTLDYQPSLGFVGEDTITYQITDSISGSDTAELIVTVGSPNTDPDADPDTTSTTAGTAVTVFPLGNDTDPDGDTLTITAATAPDGTVTVSPDGTSVTYTPDPGFDNDVDTITYTISDGNGGTDTTTIQVIVGTPGLDGIVEGTAAGEYIGEDDPTTGVVDPYLGDPEGDQVDNSDAIAPEAGADDDVIQAGAGDDTIEAGEGNDLIEADEGDDIVDAGDGDDTVIGGDGSDSIDTGEGNDSVLADDGGSPGFGNDTVTTGDGSDTVGTGLGDDVIDTSGSLPLIDNAPFPSIPTDANPDDDRDFVDADEGNDLITTGDDADTIIAGEGNDTVFSGIDDDSVIGDGGDDLIVDPHGADFIDGGDGDDTIQAGVDAFTDYIGDDPNLPITDSGITFVTDPDTDDGKDTVFGGAGNDLITTGDDADSIDGGADNDTIFAGIDDDTVRGGDGDDSIEGGHGADTISGGAGNDYIDAGHTSTTTDFEDEPDATEPAGLELNDRDVVFGGSGDDTIIGGDDDDMLFGGNGLDSIDGGIDDDTIDGQNGDDVLSGGDGDDSVLGGRGADTLTGDAGSDTLDGGDGNDTLTGGADADSIFGGAGEDSIVGATAGDTIDGGEGPVDFDVLDLTGAGAAENVGGRVTVTYDAPGSEGGVVNFLDAGDVVTGTARFDNIENVIPCFTPGTLIATPTGERKVEDLQVGDRVITRDNGMQEIRWAGAKELSGAQLAANDHLQPILIQAGALGDNLPERDILVSPQHRMLLTTDQAAMYFEEREVLVAAKHLTMLEGVDRVESSGTTYIHIMFDQHEVVLSNGTWSESFQPGDYSLDGIGKEQRDEILELFPELATQQGSDAYQAARRTLKKYEAALLLG